MNPAVFSCTGYGSATGREVPLPMSPTQSLPMNPIQPLSLAPLPMKSTASSPSGNGSFKRRAGRVRRTGFLVKAALALAAVAALGWGGRAWLWPKDAGNGDVLGTVTRGDLDITVSE